MAGMGLNVEFEGGDEREEEGEEQLDCHCKGHHSKSG